ncbi:hypothetical protein ASF21_15460 [Arthrobacter sp. Leaf234]|nr:hypothetical protein ASF21_15460 [Arthrobacter sp. Leaf234]
MKAPGFVEVDLSFLVGRCQAWPVIGPALDLVHLLGNVIAAGHRRCAAWQQERHPAEHVLSWGFEDIDRRAHQDLEVLHEVPAIGDRAV